MRAADARLGARGRARGRRATASWSSPPPDAEAVPRALPDDAAPSCSRRRTAPATPSLRAWRRSAASTATCSSVSGDTPLIRGEPAARRRRVHRAARPSRRSLTAHVPPPHAYGRVVRDGEQRRPHRRGRATRRRRSSRSTSSTSASTPSTPTRCAAALAAAPPRQRAGRALPDRRDAAAARRTAARIVGRRAGDASRPRASTRSSSWPSASRCCACASCSGHMLAGVRIVDPATTYVEPACGSRPDCRIDPSPCCAGDHAGRAGARLGPHAVLVDAERRRGLQDRPVRYLRPGCTLAAGAKAGRFVELKNSHVGEGAKVPHLSYVGDADIGAGTTSAPATSPPTTTPATSTARRSARASARRCTDTSSSRP